MGEGEGVCGNGRWEWEWWMEIIWGDGVRVDIANTPTLPLLRWERQESDVGREKEDRIDRLASFLTSKHQKAPPSLPNALAAFWLRA